MAEKKTTEDENIGILVKLEPHVIAEIDRRCGGRGGGRGRLTGRSRWVRELIHRALKIPLPEPPGEEEIDVSHVTEDGLDRKSLMILRLYRKGFRMADIAAYLTNEGIPASRGGAWRKHSIRRVLERLAKRASQQQARAIGAPNPTAKATRRAG